MSLTRRLLTWICHHPRNIDGLEAKAGLSYGLGNHVSPPPVTSARRPPLLATKHPESILSAALDVTAASVLLPGTLDSVLSAAASTSSSLLPGLSDTYGIPRCIPLHGHLSTLSCRSCGHILPLAPYLDILSTGTTFACPSCQVIDVQRKSVGARSRGVGLMKPDVVLYGEAHPEGERVGAITRRDLMGPRPDLLIVVGTSLKVPGTKLLVKELAKVIKPVTWEKVRGQNKENISPLCSMHSASSGKGGTKRKLTPPKPKAIHTIYVNLEFPTPSREFKDVFDVWMNGDIQEFVEGVEQERLAEVERLVKVNQGKRERGSKKTRNDEVGADGAPSRQDNAGADKGGNDKAPLQSGVTASWDKALADVELPPSSSVTDNLASTIPPQLANGLPRRKNYSMRAILQASQTLMNTNTGACPGNSKSDVITLMKDQWLSSTTTHRHTLGGLKSFKVSKPGLTADSK
ncbi:hypothetical protein P7C70_g9146, partial [Phenoliferia sp. Uapishka_3]